MTPEQIRADRELSKPGPWHYYIPRTVFTDGGTSVFLSSESVACTPSGMAWHRRAGRLIELEDAYMVLTDRVAQLEKALTLMVDEKVGYMMLNKLGNPEDQHTIKQARTALTGEKL